MGPDGIRNDLVIVSRSVASVLGSRWSRVQRSLLRSRKSANKLSQALCGALGGMQHLGEAAAANECCDSTPAWPWRDATVQDVLSN